MKNKVIFGCVIYSQVMQYMDEFIENLSKQTSHDFFLLIVNDGVKNHYIESKILSRIDNLVSGFKIIENVDHIAPEELRVLMILEAKKIGDILVIGDADDLFSENRIESVCKTFEKNEDVHFVYNDLKLFDDSMAMPSLPVSIFDVRELLQYNFLGMSNTAIRVSAVDEKFILSLSEPKPYVFDWYLYSRLLLNGYKGMKCDTAYTLYRIYNDNFIGLPGKTKENIEKEINVKKKHYNILKKYSNVYKRLYVSYMNSQIEMVKDDSEKRFWWSYTKVKI